MMPAKTNSRRRLNAGAGGDYIKVVTDRTETDGFVNEQWSEPQTVQPTPWKTIVIILTLFVGGVICMGCAALDWLNDENKERMDRIWALIIIGALTIIPGGYYFYVLACILMRRDGYTMDEIRRLS